MHQVWTEAEDISKPPTLRSESCPIAIGETDPKLVDMLVNMLLPNATQCMLASTCSLGSSEILSLWRGLSCVITADFPTSTGTDIWHCLALRKRKAQRATHNHINMTCVGSNYSGSVVHQIQNQSSLFCSYIVTIVAAGVGLPCSRSIMEAENNRRNPYIFTSEDRQGVHLMISCDVK